MKKRVLMCLCGGCLAAAAMAADPYEGWLTAQQQRGTEIEFIRVANDKQLLPGVESDQEVAAILEALEALEENDSDREDDKDAAQ